MSENKVVNTMLQKAVDQVLQENLCSKVNYKTGLYHYRENDDPNSGEDDPKL